jgi:hypothetical protein
MIINVVVMKLLSVFFCFLALTSFAQPQAVDTRTLTGPLLDQAKVKQGDLIPADLVIYSETGKNKRWWTWSAVSIRY